MGDGDGEGVEKLSRRGVDSLSGGTRGGESELSVHDEQMI